MFKKLHKEHLSLFLIYMKERAALRIKICHINYRHKDFT